MNTVDELLQNVLDRNHRALGRAISVLERGGPDAGKILSAIYPLGGKAAIIGITGPPGAGKSTLVDKLSLELLSHGNKVAILAVDPSSPLTGGAVLGDRIRMHDAAEDPALYIRSLATRGSLGGIAHTTRYAAAVLDAAGFDFILIETVGVGQAEVDIVKLADITAVVLVPGMGDTIQTLKAGILEVADVFIVNKSDYDGAERLVGELRSLGELSGSSVPIVKTVATQGEGVPEVCALLQSILKERRETGELARRRRVTAEGLLLERVRDLVVDRIVDIAQKNGDWSSIVEQLGNHKIDTETAAQGVYANLFVDGSARKLKPS